MILFEKYHIYYKNIGINGNLIKFYKRNHIIFISNFYLKKSYSKKSATIF